MKASFHPCPDWIRKLYFAGGVILLLAHGVTALGEPVAGANTNWLALPDLLKKWAPVPLPDIQRAAEQGDASAGHYLGYSLGEGLRGERDPEQAAAWYKRAMQAGYLPSANNLGLLYQRGLLGTNHLGEAVYYYRYAADRGLPQSQFNLAVLYRDGTGVAPDPVAAMYWFKRAADGGKAEALVEIGRLYRFGRGVSENPSEAIQWFKRAARLHFPLADFNLGLIYDQQGDSLAAFQYYQQAAEQGLREAMTELYCCYWDGIGVVADHHLAMEWLTKAAAANDPRAQYLMGYRCENPEWETNRDGERVLTPQWQSAFHWYELSARQGWAAGQLHLGLCYLAGKVVEQDEARGLNLVRTAADQGMDEAAGELASLYAHGIGEPRDDQDRPMKLLVRCQAWETLQFRYEYGLGTPRDLVMAARCFSKILLHGTWYYSANDLAGMIEFHSPDDDSVGTPLIAAPDGHVQILGPPSRARHPEDEVLQALSLYLKAALGNGSAAWQIGNRYLIGQDAPKSSTLAWAWFAVAAQNGFAEARAKQTRLAAQLSVADLQAGQDEFADLTNDLRQVAAVLPSPDRRQNGQ